MGSLGHTTLTAFWLSFNQSSLGKVKIGIMAFISSLEFPENIYRIGSTNHNHSWDGYFILRIKVSMINPQ